MTKLAFQPYIADQSRQSQQSPLMSTSKTPFLRKVFINLLLSTALLLAFTTTAFGATFTVNSTGDISDETPGDSFCDTIDLIGDCTLRAAIEEANALGGSHTINFNIPPDGPHSIILESALPSIIVPISLDGTSQPIYAGIPLIEVSGSGSAEVLNFSVLANNSSVYGLILNDYINSGIESNAGNFELLGSWLGLDNAGAGYDVPANQAGITVNGDGTIIGGIGPNEGNVISANNWGIVVNDSNTEIIANFIGTNTDATEAIGNNVGIRVNNTASDTIIGSSAGAALATNIISGNLQSGISDSGNTTTIHNNFIGTDITGTSAIPNDIGIILGTSTPDPDDLILNGGDPSTNTLIGSASEGAGNLISGNTTAGIGVLSTIGVGIRGNLIGTDITGMLALPNQDGILFASTYENPVVTIGGGHNPALSMGNTLVQIGDPDATPGNLISGNTSRQIAFLQFLPYLSASVQGNYIGTDITGEARLTKTQNVGIYNEADNVQIGGNSLMNFGNTIAGFNDNAIEINIPSTDTMIQGNRIGRSPTQVIDSGENSNGISMFGGNNIDIVGGNNISGFLGGAAIRIDDDTTNQVTITGNSIGSEMATEDETFGNEDGIVVNSSGLITDIEISGNGLHANNNGIVLFGAFNTTELDISSNNIGMAATGGIGGDGYGLYVESDDAVVKDIGDDGTLQIEGNSIGNYETGISLTTDIPNVNITLNNRIGRLAGGCCTPAAPNLLDGISIQGEDFTGLITLQGGNYIVNNGRNGITHQGGQTLRIIDPEFLQIYENGELGIDLGTLGYTPNDPLDEDDGPNGLQNHPIITSVEYDLDTDTTSIFATLNSEPGTVYTYVLFSDDSAGLTDIGQGRDYLFDDVLLATDIDGNIDFQVDLAGDLTAGDLKLSMIAISPDGEVSEFGPDPNSVLPAALTIPIPTYNILSDTILEITDPGLNGALEYGIILQTTDPDFGGTADLTNYLDSNGQLQACDNPATCPNLERFDTADLPTLFNEAVDLLTNNPSYYLQLLGFDSISTNPSDYSEVTEVVPTYLRMTNATYDTGVTFFDFDSGSPFYVEYKNINAENDGNSSSATLNITNDVNGDTLELLTLENADTGLFQFQVDTQNTSNAIVDGILQALNNVHSMTATITANFNTTVLDMYEDFEQYADSAAMEVAWVHPFLANDFLNLEVDITQYQRVSEDPAPDSNIINVASIVSEVTGNPQIDLTGYTEIIAEVLVENSTDNFGTNNVQSGTSLDDFNIFLRDSNNNFIVGEISRGNFTADEFTQVSIPLNCDPGNFMDFSPDGCNEIDLTDIISIGYLAVPNEATGLQLDIDNISFANEVIIFDVRSITADAVGDAPPPPLCPDCELEGPDPTPPTGGTTTGGSTTQAPDPTDPTDPTVEFFPFFPSAGDETPQTQAPDQDPETESTTPRTEEPSITTEGSTTTDSTRPEPTQITPTVRTLQQQIAADRHKIQLETCDLETLTLSGYTNCDVNLLFDSEGIIKLNLITEPTYYPTSNFPIVGTLMTSPDLNILNNQVNFTLRSSTQTYNLGSFQFDYLPELLNGNRVANFIKQNTTNIPNGIYTLTASVQTESRTTLTDSKQIIIGREFFPEGLEIPTTPQLLDFSGQPESRIQYFTDELTGQSKYITKISTNSPTATVIIQPDYVLTAYWNSLVLTSTALSDSTTGITEIQAPSWFKLVPGYTHTLTAYAYDPADPRVMSESLIIEFTSSGQYLWYIILALLALAALGTISYLVKSRRHQLLQSQAPTLTETPLE